MPGQWQGQQLLPASAIADIAQGGDKTVFARSAYRSSLPGWSYRDMWWHTGNAHGAYMARGVHGQALYIDPKAEMVIARFASYPVATNRVINPTTLPAYDAMARALTAR